MSSEMLGAGMDMMQQHQMRMQQQQHPQTHNSHQQHQQQYQQQQHPYGNPDMAGQAYAQTPGQSGMMSGYGQQPTQMQHGNMSNQQGAYFNQPATNQFYPVSWCRLKLVVIGSNGYSFYCEQSEMDVSRMRQPPQRQQMYGDQHQPSQLQQHYAVEPVIDRPAAPIRILPHHPTLPVQQSMSAAPMLGQRTLAGDGSMGGMAPRRAISNATYLTQQRSFSSSEEELRSAAEYDGEYGTPNMIDFGCTESKLYKGHR